MEITDPIERHEIHPRPFVRILQILVRYSVSLSTAASVTSSLAGVLTVRGPPAFTRAVGVALRVSHGRCGIVEPN